MSVIQTFSEPPYEIRKWDDGGYTIRMPETSLTDIVALTKIKTESNSYILKYNFGKKLKSTKRYTKTTGIQKAKELLLENSICLRHAQSRI